MINQSKFNINKATELPEFKWLVAILLSFIIATLIAVNRELHIKFLIEYLKLFFTMLIAFKLLDNERKLKYAILFYLIGVAYIGFEAFNVGRNSMLRVEGIGMVDSPDANTTAATLVPALPLLIYYGWQAQWKMKLVYLGLTVLIVNGLVLINSRGAFLGAFLGIVYFLTFMFFSKYKLPKQRLMLTLIFVAIIIGSIRLMDDHFWQRMQTIESTASKDSEGSGGRRINFWLATFDVMKDHPLGVGIYGYQTLSPYYIKDESSLSSVNGEKMRAVHSIWFQGIAEIGWHGFFFFIMLLHACKKHMSKAKKRLLEQQKFSLYYQGIALEAAMIGYLASSTFIDQFRSQILYWLLLFCISFSVISLRKNQQLKPD